MTAATAVDAAGSRSGVVRRTLSFALLRAGRCEPTLASQLVSTVRLTWDPALPGEVELYAPGPVHWWFDRAVLIDGLRAPARAGQVFVGPLPISANVAGGTELRHEIVLDPGHDRIALQVRTRDLAAFVAATGRPRPVGVRGEPRAEPPAAAARPPGMPLPGLLPRPGDR